MSPKLVSLFGMVMTSAVSSWLPTLCAASPTLAASPFKSVASAPWRRIGALTWHAWGFARWSGACWPAISQQRSWGS